VIRSQPPRSSSIPATARLAVGYLWALLMFAAVRRIFSVLNCTSYGDSFGRRYVATALWERCDLSPGTAYSAVFGFGVVLGVAYVAVTIVAIVNPLWGLLRGGARCSGDLSPWATFLLAPYNDANAWWEAVQVAKRLAIALLQALSPFQSSILPVGVSLVLSASLLIQAWRKPMRAHVDNVAESLSATLLLATYMSGLVVSNAVFASGGTEGIAWFLVVLNFVFAAWLVGMLVWRVGRRVRTELGRGSSGGGHSERATPLLKM
jgi:hypothetical protein